MKSQSEIPGTERVVNKKVENAGDLLVSATKKKTAANINHKQQEAHLLEVMVAEGVDSYTSEDLGKTFEVNDLQKVKVSAWKEPKQKPVAAEDGE